MYQLDIAGMQGARTSVRDQPLLSRIPRTVLLLGIVSCLTDVSSEMISSVLPIYALVHLGLSPIQFGFLDGLYQGVAAIAHLAGGVVSDRLRRHKVVAGAGYAMSAISKLGFLILGSGPATLAAIVAVDRTGKGIRTAPRDAMISLSTREGDLAAAFGVHRSLDTLGVVIGPLVAYLVLQSAPDAYDAVFVVSFAVAVIGVGVLLLLVDERGRQVVARTRTSVREMMKVAADPGFRTVLITGVLMGLTVMSDAFLYLVLQRQTGAAVTSLPLFYIGTALCYLTLAIPVGRLADRIGRAPVYAAGHVLLAALYGVALAWELNTAGLVVCITLYGAYYSMTDGVLTTLASKTLRPDVRASGLGAVATGTSLAKLCGSVLLGAVWSWRGPAAVLTSCLVGTMVVLACATTRLARLDDRRGASEAA